MSKLPIYKIAFTALISLVTFYAYSQEFNQEQQYQQAMANAKMAFSAKKYSEAVVFYREALTIKPNAKLPQYKIEDIRTIYIEKELKKMDVKVDKKAKKEKNRKDEKPITDPVIKQAEAEADRQMEADAQQVKAELQELKIETKAVPVQENVDINMDSTSEVKITPDRNSILPEMEAKQQTKLTTENEQKPEITISKKEILEQKAEEKQPVDSVKPIKQTEHKKISYQPEQPQPKVKPMTAEEKKAWVKQEQERLKAIYPNKKTIEESDKPGKHITRVIMNIDGTVVVYLKVKHSWGGLYFFIDSPGEELKSISEQYFNLMTNLETYGN